LDLGGRKWQEDEENFIMRNFIICTLHQTALGQKKEDEMGTKQGDDIKMGLKEIVWVSVDCIHPAQDRVQWWALVNTAMNLRAPQKVENFLTS
jgi:hypothetical protein